MTKKDFEAIARASPNGKLERRIVANLIAHLEGAGFSVDSVYDGGDYVACNDAKSAMEAIFAVDDTTLRVRKDGFKLRGVLLIGGNGIDIISDYSAPIGDPDGFCAAMEAFDPSRFLKACGVQE